MAFGLPSLADSFRPVVSAPSPAAPAFSPSGSFQTRTRRDPVGEVRAPRAPSGEVQTTRANSENLRNAARQALDTTGTVQKFPGFGGWGGQAITSGPMLGQYLAANPAARLDQLAHSRTDLGQNAPDLLDAALLARYAPLVAHQGTSPDVGTVPGPVTVATPGRNRRARAAEPRPPRYVASPTLPGIGGV